MSVQDKHVWTKCAEISYKDNFYQFNFKKKSSMLKYFLIFKMNGPHFIKKNLKKIKTVKFWMFWT
jgi:hypothetical protein